MPNVQLKRVYEPPSKDDGMRILVDRLWPRGLTKKKAAIDLWLRDIAPTTELRKWFGHDPTKWKTFQVRYRNELRDNKDVVDVLKGKSQEGNITLLYGAKDEQHNEAQVLRRLLDRTA
jgi:uncharacterized protein YeaO (DUF488 family)